MPEVKSSMPTDDPPIAQLLGQVFGRLAAHFPAQEWHGLRQSHFRVLWHVPSDGCTITQLADMIRMTKQGCGQFIAALQRDGYLSTVLDPADRRRRLVLRTPAGDAIVASMLTASADLEAQWRARVGAQRYHTFRSVLDELASGGT